MARKPRRQFGALRQLPSGAWQASYTGPDTKRYNAPHTFNLREAAEAWLARERLSIETGTWAPPLRVRAARVTVEDYGREWIDSHRLSHNTRAIYRSRLEDLVYPTLGNRAVADLTPAEIRYWLASLARSPKRSREVAFVALSALMTAAARDQLIEVNPCHGIKAVTKARRKASSNIIEPSELTAVAEAIEDRYALLVLLGGWCALRWGEATELRRSDIDLAQGLIHVTRQVQVLRPQGEVGGRRGPRRGKAHNAATYAVVKLKTDASERVVAIPPHLLPLVEAHLERHVGRRKASLLFTSPRTGEHLPASTFHTIWKRALTAAGLPPMRFHDLRHTGATLAARTGATTKEVMDRLGHTTPSMAMLYQHATRERDRAIANGLSDLVA